MLLTERELWTVVHGLVLGTIFLLGFTGGIADLWSLRADWVTMAGVQRRIRRLKAGICIMAVLAWLTVLTGMYVVFPWYRAKPPTGADLTQFPKSYLLADPSLAGWHTFGMEWKEHVTWLSPILATAVAYVVVRYGTQLAREEKIRQTLMVLFTIAFLAAGVAGLFGILINKAAPIR